MSMARTLFSSIAGSLLLLTAAQAVQAQTVHINFDDLAPDLVPGIPISSPYNGLTWNLPNAGNAMGWMTQGNTYYTDIVCRSGNNCAFNGYGLPSGVYTGSTMTFSGWIRRWNWADNTGSATSVLLEALNSGGTVVSSQTLTLSDSYQQFNFSSLFTTLRFTPTGGTGLACSGPENCGYFLLDDVIINPTASVPSVPEPSTYVLMATGLIGLGLLKRRRRVLQS
jgi:hypothetical protein